VLLVAARQDVGVLYGMFHLLRLMQRGTCWRWMCVSRRRSHCVCSTIGTTWIVTSSGYAGSSLWDWQTLPHWRDPRYTDYAVPTPRSASTAPSSTTSMPAR
jgi:alpha-glucuronidase